MRRFAIFGAALFAIGCSNPSAVPRETPSRNSGAAVQLDDKKNEQYETPGTSRIVDGETVHTLFELDDDERQILKEFVAELQDLRGLAGDDRANAFEKWQRQVGQLRHGTNGLSLSLSDLQMVATSAAGRALNEAEQQTIDRLKATANGDREFRQSAKR